MSRCTLPKEKILELYDYGMIDYIIFTCLGDVEGFGEKLKLVIGNMTTSEIVQAQFHSTLPKSHGLTEEPAQHEIFVVPIRMATYLNSDPPDIKYINDINFYLFLETEERRKYEPWWYNFNLVAKGRTIQIWVPSNWKMRLPFAGKGLTVRAEDIMERDPEGRLPIRLPIIDYDVTTSEELSDDNDRNVDQDADVVVQHPPRNRDDVDEDQVVPNVPQNWPHRL